MYRNYLYTCINNTVFIEYKFRTIVMKTIDNSQYNKYNFSLFRLSLEIILSKKKVPYFFSFFEFFVSFSLSFFLYYAIFKRALGNPINYAQEHCFPNYSAWNQISAHDAFRIRGKSVNQTSTLCFLVFSQNHVLFGEWGFAPIAKYKWDYKVIHFLYVILAINKDIHVLYIYYSYGKSQL